MIVYCLFSLLGVFSFCEDNTSIDNVELTISVCQTKVVDSLFITVVFENNTETDLSILNRQSVSTSNNPLLAWNLSILYHDSIIFVSPLRFINVIKPTREEYIVIGHGDSYAFTFCVNFAKLVPKPLESEYVNLNRNYGEYSVKLTYKDPFCIGKNVIREKIESNLIRLLYGV